MSSVDCLYGHCRGGHDRGLSRVVPLDSCVHVLSLEGFHQGRTLDGADFGIRGGSCFLPSQVSVYAQPPSPTDAKD